MNKLTILYAWALAFLLSFCSAMCLVTGFDLPGSSIPVLAGTAGAAALCCGGLRALPFGDPLLRCLTALLAGCLILPGEPLRQTRELFQILSQVYHSAYGWGCLPFPLSGGSIHWPLCILIFLSCRAVTRCICRGCRCWAAVILPLLGLAPCLVVTDTVPDTPFLFGLMAGIATLLLTGAVRRQSIRQADRLTCMVMVPVLAAGLILFRLVPQQSYIDRTPTLREDLRAIVLRVGQQTVCAVQRMTAAKQPQVDLSRLGKHTPSPYPVMQVTSDSTGELYLRGWDCDIYTGTGWVTSPDREEFFPCAPRPDSVVTIQTRQVEPYRFLPYYPGARSALIGGKSENGDGSLTYRIPFGSPGTVPAERHERQVAVSMQPYLTLPGTTRRAVGDALDALLSDTSRLTPEAICQLVRGCAEYDLDPSVMPKTAEDFALWFLEEGERGYCVHFATTAVVLLRWVGIPARYVSGYLVHTTAGESVTVTRKDAHAWAEYYDAEYNIWRILEATPAASPASRASSADALGNGPLPEPSRSPPTASHIQCPWLSKLTPLLLVPVLILLIALCQRFLRIWAGRLRLGHGQPNVRALRLWQENLRLYALLGTEPPRQLAGLAQKAKFSQHHLRPEELAALENSLHSARSALRASGGWDRLIHQYIYAIY